MQAKAKWQEGLAFSGSADSGFELKMDAKKAVGGGENGFAPMELIALGLVGCTGIDVLSILKKKRQEVTDFEVQVDAPRASEHPTVFTQAQVLYLVSGHDVGEKAVLRAIELSAERYCPAQAMLGKVFPIELRYQIFEDQDGEKTLKYEGVYTLAEQSV